MTGKYRITNWPEVNRTLRDRGSLTLWFSDDCLQRWQNPQHNGRKCRPRCYSDEAILTILMVRIIYHLPLRALEGCLLSIVQLLGLAIRIPSYSQICRRAGALGKSSDKLSQKRPMEFVFDATGLKVYGDGE